MRESRSWKRKFGPLSIYYFDGTKPRWTVHRLIDATGFSVVLGTYLVKVCL